MTGTYTDIVNVIAPSSAVPGEQVTVEVQVKSINPSGAVVTVTGNIGGIPVYFGSKSYALPYGYSQSFYETFIMPSSNAIVYVWSWIQYSDGSWQVDDETSVAINVEEEPPGEITGEITGVRLKVDSRLLGLPASDVAVGDSFILYVDGKNTSAETVKMGLSYIFTKPSGAIITRYVNEAWPYTPAGDTHNFEEGPAGIGTRFEVDEPGQWHLLAKLFGNDGLLDTYDAIMFTATGEEPPNGEPGEPVEGIGEITEVILIYGTNSFGNEYSPPVSGVKTGNWFKIKVSGTNEASGYVQLGLHYIITKPNGATVERTVHELYPPYTPAGGEHTFIEGPAGIEDAFNVDQEGPWSLDLEWLGLDDQVGDTWQGNIFTAEAGMEAVNILDLIPMMVIVMMMSMMMSFIEEPGEFIEKAGKAAAPIVQIFTKSKGV